MRGGEILTQAFSELREHLRAPVAADIFVACATGVGAVLVGETMFSLSAVTLRIPTLMVAVAWVAHRLGALTGVVATLAGCITFNLICVPPLGAFSWPTSFELGSLGMCLALAWVVRCDRPPRVRERKPPAEPLPFEGARKDDETGSARCF